MAATFVNLETGSAFRVVSTEESRALTAKYEPGIKDRHLAQLAAYKVMPLETLFTVKAVSVDVPINDMPGPTRFKAVCESCQTVVRDKREVLENGRILCRTCAFGAYYVPLENAVNGFQGGHNGGVYPANNKPGGTLL